MRHSPIRAAARPLASVRNASLVLLLLFVSGCASLGASGPEARTIRHSNGESVGAANIQIIPVNEAVARRVLAASPKPLFSETFHEVPPAQTVVGRGDVLQISIWEAPPALLFGSTASFGGDSALESLAGAFAQQNSIPELMVNNDGFIRVPFAGEIRAAGRTPEQIESEIIAKLRGKAHDPQVAVRISHNATVNVTLVGDAANNTQVPLTPKGERVLDVLASAGGVKTPINKTTIQIARNGRTVSMPLEAIIRDPSQNIRLQPNDVVTALSQTYSFIALGATGSSSEVPFESTGITLSQALGRAGGLNPDRADIRGVFIFRLEDPAAVDPITARTAHRTPDGRIPVVYTVDMKDPANFFVAQSFPIRDKDILYVSRAPLTDLQKFVSIAMSMVFPFINLSQSLP